MSQKIKDLTQLFKGGPTAAVSGIKCGTMLVSFVALTGQAAIAADAAKESACTAKTGVAAIPAISPIQTAYNLYQIKSYAASADAYEAIIHTAAPEPRLYYYAALANRESGRTARAKQLFEYISKNFPQAQEAVCAQTALSVAKPHATAEAVATAPAEASKPSKARVKGACVFSTEEIAREGANAIDQSRYPNCWFEASMSALAQLPRGQRLLADMIHYGDGLKYIVRFPGDGKEYMVSEGDAALAGIRNRAVWASLLECAQIRKFPNNQGASGDYGDQSRLDVGMGCITGRKAEELLVKNASVSELSSFIGGAVRSQNPIIAGTYDPRNMANYPQLVVGPHAYTIIGLDPAKNMVIMRNPHGSHSQRFSLPSDPQHIHFEQLDDGVFKMNLEIFPNYFYSIARSFI